VDDLRADGPQEKSLERIQAAASYDDQVGILRRLDDDVAWIALRLDRLGLDPSC
jgi:hypothetical protein